MKKVKLSSLPPASFNSRGLSPTTVWQSVYQTADRFFLIADLEVRQSEVFFVAIYRTESRVPSLFNVSCSFNSDEITYNCKVKKMNEGSINPKFYIKVENGRLKVFILVHAYHIFSKSVVAVPNGISAKIPEIAYVDQTTLTEIIVS